MNREPPPPFRLGQPVQLTAAGHEALRSHYSWWAPPKWQPTGFVVGYTRKRGCVRVKLDGVRYSSVYHVSFWEPLPEDSLTCASL